MTLLRVATRDNCASLDTTELSQSKNLCCPGYNGREYSVRGIPIPSHRPLLMPTTAMFRSVVPLALWLLLWISSNVVVHVGADFGDYADYTFECPSKTTCPVICVANTTTCPTVCEANEQLCADGSCIPDNEVCLSDLVSPCACNGWVVCAKTIDFWPSCSEKYQDYYDNATACAPSTSIDLVTFREPSFIFCYSWITGISAVIVAWCFFNQVLFPVKGSTRSLDSMDPNDTSVERKAAFRKVSHFNDDDSDEQDLKKGKKEETIDSNDGVVTAVVAGNGQDDQGKDVAELPSAVGKEIRQDKNVTAEDVVFQDEDVNAPEVWTQAGFRRSFVPFLCFMLVVITLIGIQILLGILTILYYVQQGSVTLFHMVFQSDVQSLKAFEIAWGVGFAFALILRWPYTIYSLFLRRCPLSKATHVAIFTPFRTEADTKPEETEQIKRLREALTRSYTLFTQVMSFIFCDMKQAKIPGKTEFIPVEIDQDGTRFFFFRYRRYNFDPERNKFIPGVVTVGKTLGHFRDAVPGLSSEEVNRRRAIIGPNSLRFKRPNFFVCLFDEFCKPFYTYQCFMVWSWFPFYYYYMALVQTGVITLGALTVSYFRYRQDCTLFKLSENHGEVTVLRDGRFSTVSQTDVVPGDAIVVKPGITCCDMILVTSEGILVDESALTGEATPVAKKAVDPADSYSDFNRVRHKKHMISAGTTVLECGEGDCDLAVVTGTGSFTAKGELLRDILSYERYQFKFDTEVKVVIFILFLYSVFCFVMVSYFLKNVPVYAFFYGIYVVGTCLPPLLPTVFTVSVGISDSRLGKKRIAVANSEGILIAGKVTKAFFDKTGTLTRQGLDFVSAKCTTTWANDDEGAQLSKELSLGMAVCHNLTLSKGGNLVGNSVDMIMFEASGATINKSGGAVVQVTDSTGEAVNVVKHFEFDHHIALQSVIVSDNSGRLVAFVKGSDEGIKKRCLPETLPADYDVVAQQSAKNGVYQISMAMKVLSEDGSGVDLVNISRNEVEQNLTFVGVINFKNLLRDESPSVIQELKDGGCQVTIITGDHVLTGIRIAKEAGIIEPSRRVLLCTHLEDGKAVWKDEDNGVVAVKTIEELKAGIDLAITGEAWALLCTNQPQISQRIVPYIRVFGRCTPNDKVAVVATFVKQGFITLMCGDGGNDCGALKTAHVGVALSDAEASVVSPFTSLDKSLLAVPEVLKEGRCALASSISSYKFMIMYGQLETISQVVNAYFKITFLEWNWVFLDGIWTITLAFSLPLARAASKLAPARPTASLLGLHTLSSACGILFLNFVFFVGAMFLLFSQDWFLCRQWSNTNNSVSSITATGDNYEAEVIFLVSGYQYISSAMAFNYGYEFRQGWCRNYVFVGLALGFTMMHIFIIFKPSHLSCFWRVNCDNKDVVRWVTKNYRIAIQNVFNTTVMPVAFRWKLFFYILSNTLAVQGYEYFIVNGIGKRIARDIKRRKELSHIELPLEDDENVFVHEEVTC